MAMKKAAPKNNGASDKAKKAESARMTKAAAAARPVRYAENDLAGRFGRGNALLPSGQSGFVGEYYGYVGRTQQRGKDQQKRLDAKKTARATTAQSSRMTAQAKAAKKKK